MSAVESTEAVCATLPHNFLDKYFFGNRSINSFQTKTAQAVCGHCAVKLACLTDAIEHPQPYGVRGGESPDNIVRLNQEMRRNGLAAGRLAAAAIRKQKPLLVLESPKAEPIVEREERPVVSEHTDRAGLKPDDAQLLNDILIEKLAYMSTNQVVEAEAFLVYRLESLQTDLMVVRDVLGQRQEGREAIE